MLNLHTRPQSFDVKHSSDTQAQQILPKTKTKVTPCNHCLRFAQPTCGSALTFRVRAAAGRSKMREYGYVSFKQTQISIKRHQGSACHARHIEPSSRIQGFRPGTGIVFCSSKQVASSSGMPRTMVWTHGRREWIFFLDFIGAGASSWFKILK